MGLYRQPLIFLCGRDILWLPVNDNRRGVGILTATAAGGTQTAVYRVGGIKGEHCRDRIEHTLSSLDGVAEVDVDLDAQRIKVAYDPAVIPSGYIEETLQTLGYSLQG